MWGVIASALFRVVGWLFSAGAIKWAFGAILLFAIAPLLDILLSFLPAWFGVESISSAAGGLTSDMWYFMDYFNVSYCLSLTLSAYATRFMIRRIPFIG